MSPLIEIRNLSKVYERGAHKVEALHHVHLDIDKGDFLALMGPSGSGKTTLLNLIGGLDSPTDGSISFDGGRIDRLGESALAKWRASSVGVYRLWRDLGYALGALLAGAVADAFGLSSAMLLVAVLTLGSGLVVAMRMTETLKSHQANGAAGTSVMTATP